jgi:(p)ppGpp synthase/HD superfamily hydrolase
MMEEGQALSSTFEDAMVYAAVAHAGLVRKGTSAPYLSHLLAVAALVLEDGGDETQAVGALLHDVAGDAGGRERLADVERRFGPAVAEIVEGCTDTFEQPKPDWVTRKDAYVARLPDKRPQVLRVSCADKLHNARAMHRDWHLHGDAVWQRFTAPPDRQRWYYRSLAEIFEARPEGSFLPGELRAVVDSLADAWGR